MPDMTDPGVRRPERGTLARLSLAAALAYAPHGLHQPLWVTSALAAALTARPLIRALGSGILPRLLVLALAIGGTLLVHEEHRTLLGRDAGVQLLLLMLGLKVLETRSRRDLSVAFTLSYFILVAGFLFSQTLASFLYAATALVLITALMNQVTARRPVALRESLGLAIRLAAPAVPVALMLFLVFPRTAGPLWSPGGGRQGVTGLSDRMTPGTISELVLSDAPAFRVTFNGSRPPANALYWRGPVLSHFDGNTWSRLDDVELLTGGTRPTPAPVTYTVILEPHHQHWLFALERPVSLPPAVRINSEFELLAPKPIDDPYRYQAGSDPGPGLNMGRDPRSLRPYLNLPSGSNPRSRALATRLKQQTRSPEALVAAALDYLSTQPFAYTLKPPPLGTDPVDRFLFETQQGFCGHFASAFAYLMRATGVPARVVTGYQGGVWNELGDYLLVRQADAHAWVEVWLPGEGWVRHDPTAIASPQRLERGIDETPGVGRDLPFHRIGGPIGELLAGLRMAWDNVNYRWDLWVVAFSPKRQRDLLERLGFEAEDWRDLVSIMAFGVALLILSTLGFILWHQRTRLPRDRLGRLRLRFDRKMARAQLTNRPGETPAAYARRIATLRPRAEAQAAAAILGLYAQIKYTDDRGPADLRHLARLIRHLRIGKPSAPRRPAAARP